MQIAEILRLLVVAGAVFATAPTLAGGANPGDENDPGPHYFGVVKDRAGDGIAGAKVTISIPKDNNTLVGHTESEGQFIMKGFDYDVDLDDIEFDCSREGYAPYAKAHSPAPDANGTVEFTCILTKK